MSNFVEPQADGRKSFLGQHGHKLGAALFWGLLLLYYVWYINAYDLTVEQSARQLALLLADGWAGPVIYIAVYTLRLLIFFPATVLTLLGGFIFGPVWGVIYTVIGSNASAMVAFYIGRFFGAELIPEEGRHGLLQKYADQMRENSFEATLMARLLFLPYDLVHYVAGFLRIDWRGFLLATIIGSIPGTISFVLLGTSFGTLEDLLAGEPSLDWRVVALSAMITISTIALSRYLKKRE